MLLTDQLQNTVQDKYRIVRELTSGGMARVFLARDVKLERDVAIKVLSPELVEPTLVERFRLEVSLIARLQHPTIIPLIEVGAVLVDGRKPVPFYVMPYAPGESVRSRLSHGTPFSVSATVRLMRDVFGALEHAHAFGLVHRDIKPENIYLSGSHAVLADFGIAKAVANQHGDHMLTEPGFTVGTPAYMAAEQLAADPKADHRADIYSAGVVAYELLTGRLPWDGDSPSERLAAQVRGEKQPLVSFRKDVPEELVGTIEQCLAYSPASRPQTATEVLRMLESVSVRPSVSMVTPVITERISTVPVLALRLERWRPPLVSAGKSLLLAIWILVNIVYAGMRAQGSAASVARAVAFTAGLPGTLVTLLAVTEGSDRAYGVAIPRR